MTDEPPVARRRRIRLPLLVVGLALVAVIVVLAVSAMQGTVTYYRTPSELATGRPQPGAHLRLGGMVVPGSVHGQGVHVRFTLTDGAHDVRVIVTSAPPSDFRAGQGAVVEGTMRSRSVFVADRVLVRHSNEYRPPSPAAKAGP